MKNIGVVLGLILLILFCWGCTEDEEIEAKVYQERMLKIDSEDPGDQDADNTRDE